MCNSAIRYACSCTSAYIFLFYVPVFLCLLSLLFFLYHVYFEVVLLGYQCIYVCYMFIKDQSINVYRSSGIMTRAYGYEHVYGRSTEYSSSFGSSLYLWSSSWSPTGRSWRSFVVRQRSLFVWREHPMSQSLDPVDGRWRRQILHWVVEERPKRRTPYCRRMRTKELKWSWKERWWLVRENVVESGISKDQRLCPRRKSTLWEPWSTSLSASRCVGCRCIPSSWLWKYR